MLQLRDQLRFRRHLRPVSAPRYFVGNCTCPSLGINPRDVNHKERFLKTIGLHLGCENFSENKRDGLREDDTQPGNTRNMLNFFPHEVPGIHGQELAMALGLFHMTT
ncbi:hypothetical protein N7520_008319 [Penicillium odoratum]|uniref:uncharacterized protein n=1 Tax=Penicillium odoratum TaxID=1167516 RepID=UPI00254961A1|nr:uncharacterized protein N7520_008319 [Penicillium odoratum]KAJ5761163.1 hypothetical protein N7520_008319 [Penicillium odoratum]